MFVVAGDTRAAVDARAEQLAEGLKAAGLKVTYNEDGDVREDMPGHEHFGFDDGVSQPGIRGRASDSMNDFITERHISDKQAPEHFLFGYPGQDLVWPGVLILGQPATSPDPLIPGALSPAIPDWTRNGSFLVFRRLRQDVGLFWRTMRQDFGLTAGGPLAERRAR
jgi:deferrochelatase/peroxidase EfeB